jgi:hypothetical protein
MRLSETFFLLVGLCSGEATCKRDSEEPVLVGSLCFSVCLTRWAFVLRKCSAVLPSSRGVVTVA